MMDGTKAIIESVHRVTQLVSEIDRLANQQRRSRGNMIRLLLEDALKEKELLK